MSSSRPYCQWSHHLRSVATYACDAGFVLDLSLGGSVTRTCFDDLDNDAEGVFSGQEPRCIRKLSAYYNYFFAQCMYLQDCMTIKLFLCSH